ncbi:hypothetical protein Calab_0709 [Caldithrix abyssi DSM 13497]|uniref:WYL domain-containing protein n=1 Tax=Caldithrix abyssi DSM 13497 TaxID=880073 RepID=H1XTB5_CALAY|nr:hypothetical protein [Caldithrix abyssi]EHO40348.1 hypothetical protein Calab_0709 [Caldithrix abyssi DSM 13497]
MNNIICSAISSRKILRFYYNGGYITVEPYCHGIGRTGNELLRAFQIGGYSESGNPVHWKLFSVNKISNISITDEEFPGYRPEYNPKDPAMDKIYCCV